MDTGESSTSSPIEEVIFTMTDSAYPFVGVSAEESCHVELEKMLPREAGAYAEFFSIDGADPDRVVELAGEHGHVEPRVLARRENGGLFEFVVTGGCPARCLAELGALPREVESTDGNGRIVAEVDPGRDTNGIVTGFLDEHPSAELIARSQRDYPTPLFTERELERAIDERLTDRQREVLRTAYEMGYYVRPRTKTGTEIADDLGISSATFSQHIRAAERNLLGILYDGRAI